MFFKKILTNTCIFYTLLITAIYTFGLLADTSGHWIPTVRIAYSLLGFSLGFAALNEVTKKLKFGFVPKYFLHLAVSALLYYLIFVLGGGFHKNGGSTLAAMLVFAFVYAIGTVIVLVLRWLFGTKEKGSKKANGGEFKSIFDK